VNDGLNNSTLKPIAFEMLRPSATATLEDSTIIYIHVKGHEQTVKLLLEKGADVNGLQAASDRGQEQMVI
jgi:hypothetical protein